MSANVAYDPAAVGWQTNEQVSSAQAFRRARRHSRVVRLLRFGIPLVVVSGVGLNVLGGWLLGRVGIDLPGIDQLGISGTRITMDRPRVAGYTRDGRPYEMQAKSAEQDLRTPQVMELSTVQTKMQMRDGATMVITANAGTYDSKAEIVSLRKNVVGHSSDGTEFRLNEITFDVRKGHMVSQQPVEVVQPRVRINANSMEVIDNGGVVRFQGGVRFIADEAASHAGKQASQ